MAVPNMTEVKGLLLTFHGLMLPLEVGQRFGSWIGSIEATPPPFQTWTPSKVILLL